jgi:hypothetical protein
MKLQKRESVVKETKVFVIKELLPATWNREATKQVLDRVHDNQFDLQYAKMLEEKGIQNKQTHAKSWTLKDLQPKSMTSIVSVKISIPRDDEQVGGHQGSHADKKKHGGFVHGAGQA